MKATSVCLASLVFTAATFAQVTNKPSGIVTVDSVPVSGCTFGNMIFKSTTARSHYQCGDDGNYHILGAGEGGGVSSVSAGTIASVFTFSIANETTTPAISLSFSAQLANCILAGPSSGSSAAPTCRVMVSDDVPSLAPSKITGTAVVTADSRLSDSRIPLPHASTHASGGSDAVTLTQDQVTGLAAALAAKLAASSNLFDLASASSARTNLGLGSLAVSSAALPTNTTSTTSQWFNAYDSSTGGFTKSQPNFSDLLGSLAHSQLPALLSGDIPNNAANTSGLSGTASALAANGTNCSSGNAAQGSDASGNAEGCTVLAITKATASTKFLTGYDSSAGTFSNGQPVDSDLSFTDITTNNATTSLHGFLPKLGGGTTNFLRADGTWAAPSSFTPPTGSGVVTVTSGALDSASTGTTGSGSFVRATNAVLVTPTIGVAAGTQINLPGTTGGSAVTFGGSSESINGDSTFHFFSVIANSVSSLLVKSTSVYTNANAVIGFASTSNAASSGAPDVAISRDAAGDLDCGTGAQGSIACRFRASAVTMNINGTAKTANYTTTATDYTVLANTSGGAFTITLSSTNAKTGQIYNIKLTATSANALTLSPSSGNIDGAASMTITPATIRESVIVQFDGTSWWVVGAFASAL